MGHPQLRIGFTMTTKTSSTTLQIDHIAKKKKEKKGNNLHEHSLTVDKRMSGSAFGHSALVHSRRLAV